jgi:beta-glucosidase
MISRPCKELIGFKKLRLEAGEKREIEFEIGEPAMGFYDENGVRHVEAGEFKIGVGFDSDVELDMSFTMAK